MLYRLRQLIFKFKTLDKVLSGIFVSSIFLRFLIPQNISFNTPHDDLLGVQIANSFSRGEWFGGWTNRTLAKPPGYSIYLSLIHFTKISPVMFTHILYLLTSLYFIFLLISIFNVPANHQKTFQRLILVFFAFNPAVLGGAFSRVYRVSLNTVLAMMFACILLHISIYLNKNTILFKNIKFILLSTTIGFIYAGMILTRSEAYWILIPALIFLASHYIKNQRINFRNYLLIVIVASIGYSIPIMAISTLNKHVYGVYQTEDFFSGEFASTYKNWSSIENGQDSRPSISISKGQRNAVYEISPTALSLKPFLETPPNTGWKTQNCNAIKICDESGIWFPWDLRDAAVAAGQITNAGQFQQFFKKINVDIQRACENKILQCGAKGLAPGTSSFDKLPKRQIIDTSVKALTSMFNFDSAAEGDRSSTTTDEKIIKEWKEIVDVKNQPIVGPGNYWLGLTSILDLLRKIYTSCFILILPISIYLIIRKKHKIEIEKEIYLFLGFLVLAIAIYSAGIAITEISAGFPIGLTLYMLPAEPLFWMLGLVAITLSYKLIFQRITKSLSDNS
jgi:hypothetical protein